MKKEKLSGKVWAKALAYILLTVSVVTLLASVAGAGFAWELQVYSESLSALKYAQFRDVCLGESQDMVYFVLNGDARQAQYAADRVNAVFRLSDADGARWESAAYEDFDAGNAYLYNFVIQAPMEDGHVRYVRFQRAEAGEAPLGEDEYAVSVKADPNHGLQDRLFWTDKGLNVVYGLRYAVYVLGVLSLTLGVVCFVFILCGAGHREGRDGLTPGYLYRVPFDLMTAALLAAAAFAVYVLLDGVNYVSDARAAAVVGLLLIAGVPLFTGWCASLSARVKLGRWWENTVIYRVLRLIWRVLCWIARLLRGLPLVWKTALALLALAFLEFVGLMMFCRNTEALLAAWLAEKLVLGAAILWLAQTLRRLQRGGQALAAGDLNQQIDTRGMVWDFKRHGENLNSAAEGLRRAVDEQMKSERLKTELITNVSHDIKTPLTSIISYVELLRRGADEAQTKEYLEVLARQSARLKKLTEDLVEVSKASTGNVEVHLERCSVSELLRQAAGEYGERLAAAGVEPVLTLPDYELIAWADGALLWRVLDNLFSNVCKYAQSGTRFYAAARSESGRAELTFKNVSREALNLSADELMERFVRGDSARSGEGSGLGLSIARSLTELQGGAFDLAVDGDLFKVTVSLPIQ